jgi:hypothetical protein
MSVTKDVITHYKGTRQIRVIVIWEFILRDFWGDILRDRVGSMPKESRCFTSSEISRIAPRLSLVASSLRDRKYISSLFSVNLCNLTDRLEHERCYIGPAKNSYWTLRPGSAWITVIGGGFHFPTSTSSLGAAKDL